MDLARINKIYMIGIKGVGMTMLAQFLAAKGKEVSGSDVKETFMTDEILKKMGIKIKSFSAENITDDADLIIYSTAYNSENNPEIAAALKRKTKTLSYAEALGGIFNNYFGIAVIGSHGKTTTTAWLGYVLSHAGLKPNVLVGSNVPQFDGASLIGESDLFIAEADEYQNKLKYFSPKGVLLNNIDYDHPDFYLTIEDYENAFIEFIKKIPKSGWLITNFDDEKISSIANVNCLGKVISYGIEKKADFVAYEIKQLDGKQFFKVRLKIDEEFEELGDFSIRLAGKHNVYNALAVIAAAIELNVPLLEVRKGLEEFSGTERRMQILGGYRGATIIDDYAHHPTEIKATLSGAKDLYPDKKIKVIFHPHTFTRTKALLPDFAASFDEADEIIVLDIYGSAREKQGGVSSMDLVEKIIERGKKQSVKHIPTLDECEKYLRKNIQRGDLVILMGAGDIFRVGKNLVKN